MKALIALAIIAAAIGIAFLLRYLKKKADEEAMDLYKGRMLNTSVIEASALIIDLDYIKFTAALDIFRMGIEGKEPKDLTPSEKYEAKTLKDHAIDLRERSATVLTRLSKEHNLNTHGVHIYRQGMNNVNSNTARMAISLDMFTILVEKLEKP